MRCVFINKENFWAKVNRYLVLGVCWILIDDLLEDSGGQVVAEEQVRVRRLRDVLNHNDPLLKPIELVFLLHQLVDADLSPQNLFLNTRLHMSENHEGQESREDA